MAVSARALSETIGAIYGAGLDPSGRGWPEALDRMSSLLAADGPVVLIIERSRFDYARAHYVRTDPADAARFQQYYARIDPVFEPLLPHARPGELLLSDQIVSGRGLRRTEFYTDWLRPLGLLSGAASILMRQGSARALMYAVRSRLNGSFTAADQTAFTLLLPHCEAAVRTSLRLAASSAARDTALSALEHCADAVLLVDAEAKVHWTNRTAEALLGDADGLAVERARHGRFGRLRAAIPATTDALRRIIATAAQIATPATLQTAADLPMLPHGGSVALPCPSGRPAYVAIAVPLLSRRESGDGWMACLTSNAAYATVALFVTDPATGPVDDGGASLARLGGLYHLTPAEASVAVAVSLGEGLGAIAASRGVALATVRTQARQVYRKVGVRGQAALARLVERMSRTQ